MGNLEETEHLLLGLFLGLALHLGEGGGLVVLPEFDALHRSGLVAFARPVKARSFPENADALALHEAAGADSMETPLNHALLVHRHSLCIAKEQPWAAIPDNPS